MPPIRVAIAGGGLAGNILLRQLRRAFAEDVVSARLFERRPFEDASPPGLNVLLNHNGCAALADADPELMGAIRAVGFEVRNWSARTMGGDVLYHLEDVVAAGLAQHPCVVARWDRVHAATRTCERRGVEYGAAIERVDVTESGSLALTVARGGGGAAAAASVEEADIVVACDGRYSALRAQLAPAVPRYGPPYVADFRIVAPGAPPPMDGGPLWRVYNVPSPAVAARYAGDGDGRAAVRAAAQGLVRVGLMRMPARAGDGDGDAHAVETGVFGNVRLGSAARPPELLRSGAALRDLFDAPALDDVGAYVLDVLAAHGDRAHWARKQETDTAYAALGGRVLFCGDSSGAIYPSLGQGANLSIEDACVVAAAFRRELGADAARGAAASDVAARVAARVARARAARRDFVRDVSKEHAEHVATGALQAEADAWNDADGAWRRKLRRLWSGWPRAAAPPPLRARTATRESFAPFGELVGESDDGAPYDAAATDAALDLSRGPPRLYLMRLDGPRELAVARITRHVRVTQCLGALGLDDDFYLAVHAPGESPSRDGLRAFRVPPRHFVKLHAGTWHAGPLWTRDASRTFVNLELADTNVTDHDSVDLVPPDAEAIPILPPE